MAPTANPLSFPGPWHLSKPARTASAAPPRRLPQMCSGINETQPLKLLRTFGRPCNSSSTGVAIMRSIVSPPPPPPPPSPPPTATPTIVSASSSPYFKFCNCRVHHACCRLEAADDESEHPDPARAPTAMSAKSRSSCRRSCVPSDHQAAKVGLHMYTCT